MFSSNFYLGFLVFSIVVTVDRMLMVLVEIMVFESMLLLVGGVVGISETLMEYWLLKHL